MITNDNADTKRTKYKKDQKGCVRTTKRYTKKEEIRQTIQRTYNAKSERNKQLPLDKQIGQKKNKKLQYS